MATTLPNRRRIFATVFPPVQLDDAKPRPTARDAEQATGERAWLVATKFLSIPDQGFRGIENYVPKAPGRELNDALAYLAAGAADREEWSIYEWYGSEMRRHFYRNFKVGLVKLLDQPNGLRKIVYCLQLIRKIYFAPLMEYLLPLLGVVEQEKVFVQRRRGFHLMIAYTLPWQRVSPLLTRELMTHAVTILGIDTLEEEEDDDSAVEEDEDSMEVDRRHSVSYQAWRDEPSAEVRMQMMTEGEDTRVTAARERLLSLFNDLELVGLGGVRAQKVFASVMNTMMTEFIRAAYSGQWEGPSKVSQHLRHWVENVYARLAVQVLAIINVPESGTKEADRLDVKLSDVEKWQEIGLSRLGALRTGELFDIIVEWPASSGAIDDLRHFTAHPAGRFQATHSFSAVLDHRLLHPGASTVEILQVYISIIRAFNLLDPKGVLLDRIARPIRRYLRDRPDTVKVIVGGLMADPADAHGQTGSGDTLVELSAELTKAHQTSMRSDRGELDWDDMNWMPDPVDAAPDYRKSKTSDVIGSLISLFDSKEAFVKEMQRMLADRLLQRRTDFDQEMSVLELLKLRFGDNALQACEVMMRDIFDSRRVDAVVRNDQDLTRKPAASTPSSNDEDIPELHAKILSHFFWPEIQEQDFNVPEEIAELQQRYADGFASLKQSRKLTWLNGLGQVTIELDLEDRVFVDEVSTWQATVIYAFNSPSGDTISKSANELAEELDMSVVLVRSACLFWVSKRILAEVQRDTFRVLEVLPNEEDEAVGGTGVSATDDNAGDASADSAAAAEAAAAAAAKESAEAAAMEKMNLYWQFIMGMLTNQGAMPLQRIVMMLKIAVPGGFPFSNEELREFLAGMVAKGKLEIVSGGNYKIVQ
ncbi:anaphase-promoting complex subunit ApcB [Aspergillus bombycis]|uniref:Anaphase-promoting complex subunit 2 n=1 Tax=Aspergillus bombycis TaxID=109264 RepID=A0A1F8AEN7_9EURO|nr:anaphase-promoting complex subunit ApcB [Aspergillus bombycis]OGM50131.1 anaphase-promoting complex subunit ApcB [Aspergillus bombycis]